MNWDTSDQRQPAGDVKWDPPLRVHWQPDDDLTHEPGPPHPELFDGPVSLVKPPPE